MGEEFWGLTDVRVCDARGCKNGKCEGYKTDTEGLVACSSLPEYRWLDTNDWSYMPVVGCIKDDGSIGYKIGTTGDTACAPDGSGVLSSEGKLVYSCASGTKCAEIGNGLYIDCFLPSTIENLLGQCVPGTTLRDGFTCTPQGPRCTPGERLPATQENPCERVCLADGQTAEVATPIRCRPVESNYHDITCDVDQATGRAAVYEINTATDAKNFSRDCGGASCLKGMCTAQSGSTCETGEVAMRSDGQCMMECKDGRWSENPACGHVQVFSYNNWGIQQIFRALGKLPPHMFDNMSIGIRHDYTDLVSFGFEQEGPPNWFALFRNLIAVGNLSNIDEATADFIVIHEFMHEWALEHLNPLGPILSQSVALKIITDAWQSSIDPAGPAPADYIQLTGCRSTDTLLPTIDDYAATDCGEDFAEHGASYVVKACELKDKSPKRYEYFRDNVFDGVEYIPEGGC